MAEQYVLHIASWYPNKFHPQEATFIQQQTTALSSIHPGILINVVEHKDAQGELEITELSNLTTYVKYIKPKPFLLRQMHYYTTFWNVAKQVINTHGLPVFCHVHVAYKASALAWYLKKKYKVKYLITEHFTAFTKASKVRFRNMIIAYSKFFAKEANLTVAISHYLKKRLDFYQFKNVKVVHNMIDDSVFYYKEEIEELNTITKFLHVSNLKEPQKNIESIIHAFAIAYEKRKKISLTVISHNHHNLTALKSFVSARYEHLPIEYKNGMPPSELAAEMRQHHCLLMYSRFETFSLVVAEAIACGLEVICSDIEGPREVVLDSTRDLVRLNDIDNLASKISTMEGSKPEVKRGNAMKIIEKFGLQSFKQKMESVYNLMA